MSISILEGEEYPGGLPMAVMYCNTANWAFGPTFSSREHATHFLKWLSSTGANDARTYPDHELEVKQGEWVLLCLDDNGDLLSDAGRMLKRVGNPDGQTWHIEDVALFELAIRDYGAASATIHMKWDEVMPASVNDAVVWPDGSALVVVGETWDVLENGRIEGYGGYRIDV